MAKPTREQERWLFEQFGFKRARGNFTWGLEGLYTPSGEPYLESDDYPPIDLNNLFEYEPLTARGYHIVTDTYKREVAGVMGQCSWVKIIDPNGNIVSCFAMKELKDALFWAIFTALGGK